MSDLISELNTLDINLVKKFSFENFVTQLRIIKIIDGDTIIGIFKFKNEFYKYNFRINGIDTAELHSKNENEKKLAYSAKEYLSNLILDKILNVTFLNFDKYGRILINIYLNNQSISDILINGGYAKKYNGGTKEKWDL